MAKKARELDKEIKSLQEFVEFIDALSFGKKAGTEPTIWFRGIGDSSFPLLPTLYRRNDLKKPEEFLDVERKIFSWFSHRSGIMLDGFQGVDKPEIHFLLQHYRIPTRLLDWTENPFIALFFALSSALSQGRDSAVWILAPGEWNKLFSVNISAIPSFNETALSAYISPETIMTTGVMQEYPIAFFGSHNNKRIAAQRGVFVAFGYNRTPMEQIEKLNEHTVKILHKIVIKKTNVAKLFKALHKMGYSASVIFPDLDGLAEEIRYKFGF